MTRSNDNIVMLVTLLTTSTKKEPEYGNVELAYCSVAARYKIARV